MPAAADSSLDTWTMDDDTESGSHRHQRPPSSAIAALLGLLLLVNLSASLYQLPLNRVVERRLCQEYYSENDPSVIGPDGNVEERLCKADPIQAGLGRIQGLMDTTWIVGGEKWPGPRFLAYTDLIQIL